MQNVKITDVSDIKYVVSQYDFENFFNVYEDKRSNYVFNLNSSMYFNVDKSYLSKYIVKYNMYWPVVSYMIYGTTRLAWLLMKLNNVNEKNLFQMKKTGDVVFYLDKDKLQLIVQNLIDG